MSLSEVVPWVSSFELRRLVLEACCAARKSSPDIAVVKIDEEERSIVTWDMWHA
jgi:hypothetical protein